MSIKKFLPYMFISLLVILAAACVNNEFLLDKYDTTVEWEPVFQGPLVYGDLSIEDLLTRFDSTGFLEEDSTGFLYLVYAIDTSINAGNWIGDLPDQEFVQYFFQVDTTIPGWVLGDTGDIRTFTEDKSYEFARIGDERLDSIHLKGGEIVIDVESTIKHAGTLTITSEAISMNGQDYMQEIQISDPSGNFTDQVVVDITGSTLRLDNSDPDTSFLDLTFTFDLINSGADILESEVVHVIKTFRDLAFQAVYGYAGTYDSLMYDKQVMDFDLLEGNFEGTIKLYDPQLHMEIKNSYGVEFGIGLEDLEGRFADGSSMPITIDPGANPIIISAPTLDQAGETVTSNTSIDRTNSNFHEIGTTNLRGLQYSVRALANPGGPTNNFMLDSSKLVVGIETVIPIQLQAKDVILQDTFDFSLSDGESDFDAENIKSLYIKLDTENGMPIDLDIQVYFVDNNWNILDSLFDDTNRNVLPSGILDENGRVIFRTQNTTEITLTDDQIDNVWNAENMLFNALFETADGGDTPVKFYSNYAIGFKLGARAEISVTSE